MKEQLKTDLIRDEGIRFKAYQDSLGIWTIGIGHNLESKPLSQTAVDLIFDDDLTDVYADLDRNVPWWRGLPAPCRRALANMCFQLGWPRLSGFRKLLTALENHDYQNAADEALDSLWARQTPNRAARISNLFIKGVKQ